MATINTHRAKDGTLSYRVRIRMRGQPTQSASFPSLKDARRWAAMIEGQIIEGRYFPEKTSSHTLAELIDRYYLAFPNVNFSENWPCLPLGTP